MRVLELFNPRTNIDVDAAGSKRLDHLLRPIKKYLRLSAISLSLISVVVLFWQIQPASAALTKQGNLVGYWPMDEANGQTKLDVSGYGNNLIYGLPAQSSSVPATSFIDNYSQSFNGSQTLYQLNPSGLPTGASGRTMSVWINPSSSQATSQSTVYSYGTCGSGNEGKAFGLFLSASNELNFWGCGSSYDFDIGSSLSANSWTNVTMTYDGSSVRIYINGSLRNTQSRSLNTGSSAIQFGSSSQVDSSTNYYRGNLDDARIYNRVLSNAEISALASGKNTSATWTGASSTSFNSASNWNIGAVPDAYTNIIVPQTSNSPELNADTGLANLSLTQLDSRFLLNGHNLTFNDGGTFSNQGQLVLTGTETLTNFTNDTDSGIVAYEGGAATTYTSLPTGYNYAGLTLHENNGSTWDLPQDLTAQFLKNYDTFNTNGHAVTLIASDGGLDNLGTINAGSSAIKVTGTWFNQGTFNAGTSTVTLNGSDQFIAGDTTFYNLSKSSAVNINLAFQAGSTTTINNKLTLLGPTDGSGWLALTSSNTGTAWNIDLPGDYNFDHIYVQDSDNVTTGDHSLLTAVDSADGGRNAGWDLQAPTAAGLSPADGSWTSDNTPTLTFTTADSDSSQVKYEIQIADNSAFNSPVADYTSALAAPGAGSYTPGSTLPDGSYYWRVKVTDPGNLSSGWVGANSGAVAFKIDTTDPTTPGKPTATSPTADTTPTLTWTASTDSGSGLGNPAYNFAWSQSSSFGVGTTSVGVNTNSLTMPSALADGTWYFKVEALDALGNYSSWSSTGSVVIDTAVPNTPTASVGGGTYSSAQTVSLTASDNSGGSGIDEIYYTTNGDTPTSSSTKYSGAISVSSSKTIKAIAYDKAGNASPIMSEDYTIASPNQTGSDDANKDSSKPSSSTTSKDSGTASKENTDRTSQAEADTSSNTNDKSGSAPSSPKSKTSQDNSTNISHEDTIELNNAKPKNTNDENTGAFLGLGWWWLLIIAFIILVWWLIAAKKRKDEDEKDKNRK